MADVGIRSRKAARGSGPGDAAPAILGKTTAMARLSIEFLVWSSRLVVPLALMEHMALAWAAARYGAMACISTLVGPVIGELVWLALLPLGRTPGWIVVYWLVAMVSLLAMLAGAAMLGQPRRGGGSGVEAPGRPRARRRDLARRGGGASQPISRPAGRKGW